jgi:hypothetical protein
MAYHHCFESDHTLIVVDASGPADYASTVAEIAALAEELRAAPGTTILIDARAGTYVPTTCEVKMIVGALVKDRALFRETRLMIVVEDLVRFGLGRMFAALADIWGIRVEVFRSMCAARVRLTGEIGAEPVLELRDRV